MQNEIVKLPISIPELDAFVAKIVAMYSLPEGDDTYDMIATMILHLPQTKFQIDSDHFGFGVLKSLANQAAFKKLEEFRKKREAKAQAEEEALKLTQAEDKGDSSNVEPLSNAKV